LFEERLALWREIGNQQSIANLLNNLGTVAHYQGDTTTAQTLLQESLAISRELGDKLNIAISLYNLGDLAREQDDYRAARTFLNESLALCQETGNQPCLAYCYLCLGLMALSVPVSRNLLTAREYISYSLRVRQALAAKLEQTSSLVGAAGLFLRTGNARRGAQLLGAVYAALNALGVSMEPGITRFHTQTLTAAQEKLGEEAFNTAWVKGAKMSIDEAVQFAL